MDKSGVNIGNSWIGSNTISTLIPVESAGSFGDGRCCNHSGYLQIALGLPPSPSPKFLRQFHQTNRVNGITPSPMPYRPSPNPVLD